MISKDQFQAEIELIIANAIREDVGDGDHSSLACIPPETKGKAKLLVKDNGVIAGVDFAKQVFSHVDPDLEVETMIEDGSTGLYWNFIGFMQLLAGILLLIPRTSFLGALIYLPIIINILIIVVAMQFRGTPYIVALMLLANLYLLLWDYKKLKAVVLAIFTR